MSKSVVYVLVPEGVEDLERGAHGLLFPYHNDCNELLKRHVPVRCWCIDKDGRANPNCLSCHGLGIAEIRCKRNRKWDWCHIGIEEDNPLDETVVGSSHLKLNGAAAAVKDLDMERLREPDAVLTVRAWYQPREGTDWSARWKKIVGKHQDTILVVVLCHR